MKTLLLCGYRPTDHDEPTLGTARDRSGLTLIDRRIEQLQAMNHEIVCVLAGTQADDQLRDCRKIQEVELVFDTNEPTTLLSNARSGVFAAPDEAVFILPLEIEPPAKILWDFLRNEYGKAGFAFEKTVIHMGAPYHYGFPLLLTRYGAKQLQNSGAFSGLRDPRLTYFEPVLPL